MRHLAVFLIYVIALSDADIAITVTDSLDNGSSLKCGTKVTLVCKIQPFSGTMVWKADNKTVMRCNDGSCETVAPYHPNYGFAFEKLSGIFNISIQPVTFVENGRQFECNDGLTSQFFTPSVKVVPEKGTTVLTSKNSTNETEAAEITVTTGCIYPVENVQFQWYYFKDGESPVLYTNGQPTDGAANDTTTDCTSGDCGGEGVKQVTSTLKFEQDEAGEAYYFQAVVVSQDVPDKVVLTSATSYKLKGVENTSLFGEMGANVGLIVTLTIIGLCIVIISVTLFVVLMSKGPPNPEKERIVRN